MKILLTSILSMVLLSANQDAVKDLSLLSVNGSCNAPLKIKQIKNNSASKTIIAFINRKVRAEHTLSNSTIIDTLKPKEVKNLDCGGCINDGPGQECTFFSIKSARYLKP